MHHQANTKRMNWVQTGKKLIGIMTWLLIATSLSAQDLAGREILPQPQKYVRPTSSTIETPVDRERGLFLTGRPWQVLVSGYKVVAKRTLTNPKEKGNPLGFLSAYFVLKDSAEFLYLITDPLLKRGKTSSQAQRVGWVAKPDLLMWQNALGDAWAWKVKKRALVTVSPDGNKKVKCFQSPELKKKRKVELSGQSYFIYRENKKFETALIGRAERFEIEEAEQVILGWVSRVHLIERPDWVYCEPNWKPESAATRQETGRLKVFSDSVAARQYQLSGKVARKAVVWEDDSLTARLKGTWQRFPVITAGEDLIKVAVYWPKKQLFLPAWVPAHNQNTAVPNVKYCLLLNRIELAELIEQMEDLRIRAEVLDARVELKNVIWEMSRPYLGPNLSMPKLSQWPFAEVLEAIFGLPSQSELGKYSMNEFNQPDKVAKETFDAFFESLDEKIETLTQIFNANNYPYSFQSASLSYYWIEADLLP